MKLTPYYRLVECAPAPAPQPRRPKYPQCYILSIGDLVTEFVNQWDTIINQEIVNQPDKQDAVFPEVFSLAPDGTVLRTVYLAQHVSEVVKWHPDISMVVGAAIETIKSKNETQQDMDLVMGMLWVDIAYMAELQLVSNIPEACMLDAVSNTRRKIAQIATQFGKQLYYRLIELGLYKDGRFPYHYVGWQHDCAIVALDETDPPDPRDAIELRLE